eukprot:CAMPEP_0203717314 /NCGR_PEP_ID=MMETSP0092-20131115/1849_1 /ASSEMBLY_ACC=CAM_ASM_001090 /TAXON_ID=426623 /ORGANISM="Chaetoceros affinis, Strain CCMP159" /LENGTH=74 /DNA_ID=CAMNT_0050596131 /DNA_START=87 /DNA_END=308 /DNA_ORIENTATION=-
MVSLEVACSVELPVVEMSHSLRSGSVIVGAGVGVGVGALVGFFVGEEVAGVGALVGFFVGEEVNGTGAGQSRDW